MYKKQIERRERWYLPAWHTITGDTTAFTVIFITKFSTAGPRCSDCSIRWCCCCCCRCGGCCSRGCCRRRRGWWWWCHIWWSHARCKIVTKRCRCSLKLMMWWILTVMTMCARQIQRIQIGICVPGFKWLEIDIDILLKQFSGKTPNV